MPRRHGQKKNWELWSQNPTFEHLQCIPWKLLSGVNDTLKPFGFGRCKGRGRQGGFLARWTFLSFPSTEFSIPDTHNQNLLKSFFLLSFYFGSTSDVILYSQWPRSILEVTPDRKRKQNPPNLQQEWVHSFLLAL